jgi:hypothetical protein
LNYSIFKIFFCIAILFFSNQSLAQLGRKGTLNDEKGISSNEGIRNADTAKGDVTKKNKSEIINLRISSTDFYNNNYLQDTAIQIFHTKMGLAYWQQNLGNVNSAVYNLKFIAPFQATQNLGNYNYYSYGTILDSIRFYNTSNPYTVLQYNAGSRQEQGVKIFHTQNINAYNNFSFSYAKYGGPGYFDLQRASRDNATISILMRPNSKSRFSGKYALAYNKNQQDENGGIQKLSDLSVPLYQLRSTVPVKYNGDNIRNTASSVNNKYRQMQIKLKNLYALRFANTPNDSVNKIPSIQVFYSLITNLEKQDYRDRDPNSDKYYTLYQGLFKSNDSVRAVHNLKTIQNEVGIQLPQLKKINASLEAAFGIEWQRFSSDSTKNTIANNYANAIIVHADSTSNWQYSLQARLYLLGKAVGNNSIDARASRKIKSLLIGVHYLQNLCDANYLMQNYTSNFYAWNNSFKKQFSTTIGGTLHMPKQKLQIIFNNINMLNYIYYTDSMQIKQNTKPIILLQTIIDKEFVYKKWNVDVHTILQQANSNNSINIPAVIANINMGYTSYIFKRSMLANIGIQATYNTNYFTPSYAAILNNYTFSSQYKQSNLPNMGIYFNGKIKRFRYSLQLLELQQPFNLNLKNFSQELGYNRILIDKYPAPDWQIKVGFSWVFLN